MNSLVCIIEIPATDFARAVKFYTTILGTTVEEVDMGEIKMGLFAGSDGPVSLSVIHGAHYKPSSDGVVAYLNGGSNLQPILDKVGKNKGTVIVPKTEIAPDMGFYAMFIDTEGNRVGLFSKG